MTDPILTKIHIQLGHSIFLHMHIPWLKNKPSEQCALAISSINTVDANWASGPFTQAQVSAPAEYRVLAYHKWQDTGYSAGKEGEQEDSRVNYKIMDIDIAFTWVLALPSWGAIRSIWNNADGHDMSPYSIVSILQCFAS